MGFIDPCKDATGTHLKIEGDTVVPLTNLGHYTITELGLNSPAHQERRRRRRYLNNKLETLYRLAETCTDAALKAALQAEVVSLMAELNGQPWDPQGACLCP